ncbi:AfsR/SARP family transcriptional regulator [Streptomyces sp. CRN 30]|uniref:AfsR/SARP family transcriptional regulator n=1 Tax=Streptomyces sp. CRN 30 TaxID=3075613 RepID=UPI002A7F65E4|nr:BTAD domain-containing putative transcriptional regulator [Streptomyces sp. CRN 30]
MRYRILGTTQAVRPDGATVPVGGARLRALLTVLALRAGRTVPAGLLVAEVWGEDPPADAPGALQALIGRLRRALGADAVASADGGYRLTAAPDDVDLHRFDRLAGDGARALADGDPAKAADALDDALALWRDPVLADLPDRTAEAARWERRHLDALRVRHTAALGLGLGHAERSLPELTALCDAHPLDEPLQALRLRALRATGRTAEALAAYEDVRRLLADRLGSDPGPELRALHAELLHPDPTPPYQAPPYSGPPYLGPPYPGASYPGTPHQGPSSPESSYPGTSYPPAPGSPPAAPRPAAGASGPSAAHPAAGAFASPVVDAAARPAAGISAPSAAHPAAGASAPPAVDAAARPAAGASAPPAAHPAAGAFAPSAGHPAAGASGPPVVDAAARPAAGASASPAADTAAHPAADAAASPPARETRPRGNLRARLTSFVGRDSDIETLRADLAGTRLVTLLGPGGSGKTRLSLEAADTAGPETARDGAWLAELAPVDDPAAVPEAVLTAVGGRETVLYGAGAEELRAVSDRTDTAVDRLVEHVGRRRMLLVLDNCEHLVDAAARLAEELLARCPGVTVLATSREPLGVPGELLRPVEPLPEPSALRLLADRGAAARAGFRVDADAGTAAACAEICRRLDGLPLAIELAAARLRVLTPRQIADRLDDRFRLLTSGSRTLLPRQQTLRAVVDWSWDLLDGEERQVLGRLSVFAGGCDLAAAEAVCGAAALDAVGSLVDKSLVVAAPDDDGGEMRYRLLETVAEYARERLDETGDRAAAARAHLTYYRELARTTDPLLRGPGQLAAVRRLEREYENIRTALRYAVAERDEQEALCLILSMVWYWQVRDLRIEARTWCAEVMTLGPDPFAGPVRPAAPVWERLTHNPPPMTGEVLAEARRGVHLAHLACMDTELDAWHNPRAQEKLQIIADTYEPGLPQTCRSPGLLWFYAVMLTGDMERLRVIMDAAVETGRTTPDFEWELAGALQMRANLLANRVEWAGDAVRDADEALEIYGRLHDAWGLAEAYSSRAEARERTGDATGAAADYEAAKVYAERLDAHAQVDVLDARLGSVLADSGEIERGERVLREVIDRTAGSAHNGAMPAARLFLAGLLGTTGRVAEAREQLRRLRQDFSIAQFVVFDAFILGTESWIDALEAHYEEALDKARRALEQAGDPLSVTIAPQMRSAYLVIAALSLAHVDGGRRAPDAARCLGAAAAMLPAGHVENMRERSVRERAVEEARAVLGAAAFDTAYAEGGGLSVGEAAALV